LDRNVLLGFELDDGEGAGEGDADDGWQSTDVNGLSSDVTTPRRLATTARRNRARPPWTT
jgi:hypothetical protein